MISIVAMFCLVVGAIIGIRIERVVRLRIDPIHLEQAQCEVAQLRERNARQINRIRDYQNQVEKLALQLDLVQDPYKSNSYELKEEPETEDIVSGCGELVKRVEIHKTDDEVLANAQRRTIAAMAPLYDHPDSWKIKYPAEVHYMFEKPVKPKREWPGLFTMIMLAWLGLKSVVHVFFFGRAIGVALEKGAPDYKRIAELENDRYIRTAAEQIIALVDRDEWPADKIPA